MHSIIYLTIQAIGVPKLWTGASSRFCLVFLSNSKKIYYICDPGSGRSLLNTFITPDCSGKIIHFERKSRHLHISSPISLFAEIGNFPTVIEIAPQPEISVSAESQSPACLILIQNFECPDSLLEISKNTANLVREFFGENVSRKIIFS